MSPAASTMAILEAIQQVVGPSSPGQPVALHEPDFRGTEAWTYVKDCLDTGWVSTAGRWVSRFEQELASATGAAHAVALTNGTVALRLALHLVGVEPGDEVLLPPLSFVATANAVAHLGAVPHFVDVEPITLAMDPAALANRLEQLAERRNGQLLNRQTGRRLAAVLPVHVFGHPADGMALRQVADAWGLPLVEDAAEALGSWRGDTHCGLFGAVGTLSFNGNKLSPPAAAAPCLPTTVSWPSERVTWRPPPSCPTPGRLSTMLWVGTTACPTSMPPWEWPSWRVWSGAYRPSDSLPSAMGPPWQAWRGWSWWPSHPVAAATTGW